MWMTSSTGGDVHLRSKRCYESRLTVRFFGLLRPDLSSRDNDCNHAGDTCIQSVPNAAQVQRPGLYQATAAAFASKD
eukprot:3638713-Pyramimonas_sp.AAC.1